MNYQMYANAYVECGDGWRWHFIVTDEAGLFEIRYEEWVEADRKWIDKGIAESLHIEAIPHLIDAMKVLKAHNEMA
jgi:hypothetical protein